MMIFIVILILWAGAVRDGLSARAAGVGWTGWHIVTWIARDAPAAIIAASYLWAGDIYAVIVMVFASTAHEQFYRLGIYLRLYLAGSAEPPRWFKMISKLWTWLPWC